MSQKTPTNSQLIKKMDRVAFIRNNCVETGLVAGLEWDAKIGCQLAVIEPDRQGSAGPGGFLRVPTVNVIIMNQDETI